MEKVFYTYEQMRTDLKQISAELKKYNFEMIIPVTRGGLVPACYLGYMLNIKSFKTLCLNCYENMEQLEMNVISVPDICGVPRDKILVVDSIVDNGTTLAKTRELLGNEVKFFTIHLKPHSTHKPDFHINITDKWIVYPWECE